MLGLLLCQDAFDGILKLTTAKGYSLGDIVQVGSRADKATERLWRLPALVSRAVAVRPPMRSLIVPRVMSSRLIGAFIALAKSSCIPLVFENGTLEEGSRAQGNTHKTGQRQREVGRRAGRQADKLVHASLVLPALDGRENAEAFFLQRLDRKHVVLSCCVVVLRLSLAEYSSSLYLEAPRVCRGAIALYY